MFVLGFALGWAVTYLALKYWDWLVKKWAELNGVDTSKWD